jgi:large subunit ribosomal protein L24
MHIKKSDTVEVICGDEQGTRGRVLRVDNKSGRVVVEGVNRVYKHVRKSQKSPQGGRLRKEAPIQLSNVLLVCGACNAATRTGARYLPDGGKERYCKKCGAGIGQIAPPKKRYAAK